MKPDLFKADDQTTSNVNKKTNTNTPLIIILCLEIVLIIVLIILITINFFSDANKQQPTVQTSLDEQTLSNKTNLDAPDTRPDCAIEKTKEEPFVSVEMDYPYAGIYESTGKYICNTDLNYLVSIPQEVTKVFYYIINGGQINIVGLETNGDILSAPITQTNYSFAWAATLMVADQESIKEIEDNPAYSNYKIVFNDATPELIQNGSSDKETQALINALYGDNTTFSIIYMGPIDAQLYKNSAYTNYISQEMLEEMEQTYNNRNQDLINKAEEIFANPDNYFKLETNK